MNKKIIYIVGGSLASGKTFLAKLLFSHLDYVAPDQFMPSGKWTKQKSDVAWDKTHEAIAKKIKQKKTFVLDHAAFSPKTRRKLVKFIHQKSNRSYIIIFIHVKSSLKDCMKRNRGRGKHKESEQQIKKYFNRIKRHPPSKEDGYDYIITIDNSIRDDENEKPTIDKEEWKEKWYHTN